MGGVRVVPPWLPDYFDQENINNANEMKDLASVNIAANDPIAEDEAQTIRLGKEKEG